MYGSAKTGIELSGISILAVSHPQNPPDPQSPPDSQNPRNHRLTYEIAPDPFAVAAGQAGIIVAPPEARRLLADVLTGLAAPTAGEVYVRGAAVTGLPPGGRGIALGPAGGGLLPHLTVERNAGFALAGTGTRNQRRAQVDDVLRRLELASLRKLRPHELSAEQRMRVAVARAMCLPGGTYAVVVEDRGTPAGRAAVSTATGQELAVLVITGTPPDREGRDGRNVARCRPAGPAGVPSDAGHA